MIAGLKICGITRRVDAEACVAAGAGALGVVFYERSPRNVSAVVARELLAGVPQAVARVGVFVDYPVDKMLEVASVAGLTTVQLHGSESLATAMEVVRSGYRVIKVLKVGGRELVRQAEEWPEEIGVLVECGKGVLPGGNAAEWDWAGASALAERRRLAVAGGLDSGNIVDAIQRSGACAWDLSSGVESTPGVKSVERVREVVAALQGVVGLREAVESGESFWNLNAKAAECGEGQ